MKKDKSEYPFLGIALGGGGVRGAAHVGVLQVLDKEKIKIGSISGVSAGAIIAAMYAYSLDAIWIEKRFRNILSSSLFNKVLQKSDIINKPSNFLRRTLYLFMILFYYYTHTYTLKPCGFLFVLRFAHKYSRYILEVISMYYM